MIERFGFKKWIFRFFNLSIMKIIDQLCCRNVKETMCYRTKQSNIVFKVLSNRDCFVKLDDKCESCLYEKKFRKVYSTLSKNITRVSKKCKKSI